MNPQGKTMPLPSPDFETQALAKLVKNTHTHLKDIGDELMNEITLELMDLAALLGECEEHPAANITIGGMASIIYRICDVFKFTGKLAHEAITASKIAPAESSETGSVASLNEELAAYQAHLGHIADQIIDLNDSLLTFIPCDLTVLEGHPEITQAKDLLEIIKQIDDQFSAVSERIYEIGIVARQISQLESLDEEPEFPSKKDRDWRAMTAMLAQCVEAAIQTGVGNEPSESKRITKGRNRMNHPKQNDKGQPVILKTPSAPTALDTWLDSSQTATATPCSEIPSSIVEIPVRRWSDAPNKAADWETIANSSEFNEPEFKVSSGKKPASGAVVFEADGRIWVISPSNQFGGYANTFPKGKIESGQKLSLKANALKEVFEETGLKVELTGFLCDSERDTSTTRFYLAKRIGGDPSDMGWESQAVHLLPKASLTKFLAHPNDKPVIEALMSINLALTKSDIVKYQWGLTSGHRILATISGYRRQFANWPTKILMPEGMTNDIKGEILTPLGWEQLSKKVEITPCDVRTVFAEGLEGTFEYDGNHTYHTDKLRPDIWIWGVQIAGY